MAWSGSDIRGDRRGRRLARAALVAATLGLVPAAPASAQWFGTGPIPPGQIVASLMRSGFLDIGRPRFDGAVYVVEGTNARGLRVRLVIDAFDGGVISRTRLDAPLLPPREVGRDRAARVDPYRGFPADEMEEELPPPPYGRAPGRGSLEPEEMPTGRAPSRGLVEREELPPPPLGQQRRSDLPPPLVEPRLGPPGAPPEMQPPGQRQARRPEATPRSPTALPAEKRPASSAGPKLPAKPREAAPASPAAPPPTLDPSGAGKPAEAQAQESAPPRSVRVIEGVAPVVPKNAEPPKAAEPPRPAEGSGAQVTVPPATLE
jgi:hypothetical protein